MRNKVWVYNTHKRKRSASDQTRLRVQYECDTFVEQYLQPRFVHVFDLKNKEQPQCVDIQWKWYRNFIHIKAIYRDVRPEVIEETYDYPIARFEYMDENVFHLAYFRHTGEWSQITEGEGIPLEECIELMKDLPHFVIY